jgi:hypothetical protein
MGDAISRLSMIVGREAPFAFEPVEIRAHLVSRIIIMTTY